MLHIIAVLPAVQDTVDPVAPADTVIIETILPDTLNGQSDEAPGEENDDEFLPVHIWEYGNRAGFTTQLTDSTLRWINVLSLTQIYSRKAGAITYRTGTLGRMDGIDYHSYENRHFDAEMEGLRINNPLTGSVNWNRVPIHKIGRVTDSDYGPLHRSSIRLKDHYLVKPRTYLNFDESTYNFRNLEFSATHNVAQGTNIELSFWDRRDDIGYRRSSVKGNQVVFKAYHQLNERWLLRSGYITNSMQIDQPFGYQVQDPSLFTFNPFTEVPNETSAESDEGSKDIYLQAHFRPDTASSVATQFGLHYQVNDRALEFSTDSVGTDFRKVELFVRHELGNERTGLSATVRPYFLENRTDQLTENNWLGLRSDIDGKMLARRRFSLFIQGGGMIRDDSAYEIFAGGKVRWQQADDDFKAALFAGYANRAPDLQALYWESESIFGNADLLNEESVTAGVETSVGIGPFLTLGGRADIRETVNGVFARMDSETEGEFENIEPFTTLTAAGWLNLDSSLFEGSASATYKSFESSTSGNPINQRLLTGGDKVWLKGDFYWKNYLFDRATFVKAGIIGTYSPNFMRTAEYIEPLNRWQHGTGEQFNPPYSRVDIDLSARIRWMMFLLRWENIFDRVNQPGYFETVGYPMPEQRFIFGVRVLFTN